MAKIKVARIISGLWQGGVQSKLTAALLRMDRSEFDVSVICLKEEGYYAPVLRDHGIPVTVCPVRRRLSPSGLRHLSNILRQQKYHIIHSHMYRANTSGTIAAMFAGVPVKISQIHSVNTWDHARQRWMDRFLVRFKDMILFVSNAVRDNYLSRVQVPEFKQRVIYNGIDIDRFCPGSPNPLGLTGAIRIGSVGRLMPAKGYEDFIDIVSRQDFADAGIVVYILGDGPLRQHLEQLARDRGVLERFRILGFQDDVVPFLNSIDILAMPSRREGFSNALLEALAVGVPPVVTAVGGNPEAVRDGIDGRLAPAGNTGILGDVLLELARDSALRKRMGLSARERARAFSINRMVTMIQDLYRELVVQKTGQT